MAFPQMTERLAQAGARLSLRHVGPEQRGEPLALERHAGPEREHRQQSQGLLRRELDPRVLSNDPDLTEQLDPNGHDGPQRNPAPLACNPGASAALFTAFSRRTAAPLTPAAQIER